MSTSQYPSGPSYPTPQPPPLPGYGVPQGGYTGQPMPASSAGGQYFKVHDEMKKRTGDGLGGALALVLALFIGVASPYLASMEVGNMYERAGRPKPVSGATGLWVSRGSSSSSGRSSGS